MLNFIKKILGKETKSLQDILQKGAVIVDVRTPGEYREKHLEGSRNVPLDEIKLKADHIRSWAKPVITVCRSGNRSGVARNILHSMGIESYNGGSWTVFKNKYGL
jgi:rhodanese-related sulfurtransferase